ncbi:FTR1 family iron permease [Peribacillus asahii]|uniref:FTR1 family iron permease n=1 Tax=Peribacillus asahii TaxID=228899 RepID=UPI00207B09A9|nr:FTR1 family protein [Peribacillus asahii]USK62199.1 FTR1 family protein [Peribacillus asahii]
MDVQALLITFREALEALLIIGVINTYLKRVNRGNLTKFIWLGVFFAMVASVGVALLFQVVFTGFAAMGSEMYLKISITLISSILLTQMVFWMAEHSRELKGKIEGKIDHFVTTGNIIGLVIHAFLVILREGIETVFFFVAITGGNIEKAVEGWGAISGIGLAALVSYFFFKGTMRMKLSTFFKITGGFIVLIAAGMLVKGISMLQDLKIVGSVMPNLYDLTWFLPEHPIDYEHYLRDTGVQPVLSGEVGNFLKALLGYSSMPSIEEVIAYIGYFVVLYLLIYFQHSSYSSKNKKAS